MSLFPPPEEQPNLWAEVPSPEEQQRLQQLILNSIKERGEGETRYRKLLTYLFEQSIEASRSQGLMRPVPVETVARAMGWKANVVSGTRTRLNNERLDTFFDTGPGRSEPIRTRITANIFALRFARNPIQTGDLVDSFWKAHNDGRTTLIYYPEPQFFKDLADTYFRNHQFTSDSPAARQFFARYKPQGILEPSQSFVPSGFVAALTTLLERLSAKLQLRTRRLNWRDSVQDSSGHAIILGTSSNLAVITRMTDIFPFQSQRAADGKNVVIDNTTHGQFRDDNFDPQAPSMLLTKWVVITRRYQHHHWATLLSGHSRAVEHAAHLLTGMQVRGCDIREIAAFSNSQDPFSGEFQLLLRTQMAWAQGELSLRRMTFVAIGSEETTTYADQEALSSAIAASKSVPKQARSPRKRPRQVGQREHKRHAIRKGGGRLRS